MSEQRGKATGTGQAARGSAGDEQRLPSFSQEADAYGKTLPPKVSTLDLTTIISNVISDVDQEPAISRVEDLRHEYPNASVEMLVQMLIKTKCRQAGAVGAATSSATLAPGIGTIAAMTLGVVADISISFKLQAELVLEIAAVHQRLLTEGEKQQAILLVTGLSAGANQLLARTGRKVSVEIGERVAQKWVTRLLPVIGIAASAGTNAFSTYVIGRRAHAYFSLGPEAVKDWKTSLRAISGIDGRKIARWFALPAQSGTGKAAKKAISAGGRMAVDSMVTVGHGAQKSIETVVHPLSGKLRRKDRNQTPLDES